MVTANISGYYRFLGKDCSKQEKMWIDVASVSIVPAPMFYFPNSQELQLSKVLSSPNAENNNGKK